MLPVSSVVFDNKKAPPTPRTGPYGPQDRQHGGGGENVTGHLGQQGLETSKGEDMTQRRGKEKDRDVK